MTTYVYWEDFLDIVQAHPQTITCFLVYIEIKMKYEIDLPETLRGRTYTELNLKTKTLEDLQRVYEIWSLLSNN